MSTTVETIANTLPSLTLRGDKPAEEQSEKKSHEQTVEEYKYAHLLPVFVNQHYAPLEPFEYSDPGLRALQHPNPHSFLDNATGVAQLTPHLGSEITGVKLTSLDSNGRDQLALEVARRGLVVFRNQEDFIDSGPDYYKAWGQHFGRLHIHPTSGHPEGLPEIHLVYKAPDSNFNFGYHDSITSTVWHSDVSYELQPPGITTFFLLAQPSTGGDTLFTNQVQVFKALSPPFQAFLRTLKAVHSGVEQAEFSRRGNRGGIVRREPVENVHPIVRRHPVTGEEALYVNRQFTRRIVGLKKEESENLLRFLYDHIDKSGDVQARVKWSPGTVVLWDNRITAHSATVNYTESNERRHGARITPQAERPIPALEGLDLTWDGKTYY